MSLAALIFDVDGTLAETEEAHRRAFNETFAEAGLPWVWDEPLYNRLLGVTGGKERIAAFQRQAPREAPRLTSAEIAALHRRKTERYAALLAEGALTPRPGVTALLDRAAARGLRLAVATTTSRPNVEALCRSCWGCTGAELFDVIAAGDEAPRKKPAPDVFLIALERLRLAPGSCLAFEDSAHGLRAALEAGLRVVATPSRHARDQDFTGAAVIAADLAELDLDGLLRPSAAR
jgi:HAD superfamily hydrolase (TIGR01509 family)